VTATAKDSLDSAAEAGLRHTTLERPGITRERAGEDWRYRNPNGDIIHDGRTIERIRSIVIPPAWTDVWISTDPRGHIQATGIDKRGRKQYRYHPKWRAYRDENKFDRLADFGRALPPLRERVDTDLARSGFPREKVLATIVKLLDTSLIRIGGKGYERENGSFGLTTLRNRHVEITGATIHFTFKGKGGLEHSIDLHDKRLARIIKRMRDLPGYHLFQYLDEDGGRHDISSEDVNRYLREVTGEHFTAKDFRTWAGTVRFAFELRHLPDPESEIETKRNIVTAIRAVSRVLGNTPAVCRSSYIHPAIIDAYFCGDRLTRLWERASTTSLSLSAEEQVVLEFLEGVSPQSIA
jgi:DNA topoisomerase-1